MKKITNIKRTNQVRAVLALAKVSFLSSLRNPTALFFNFFFPFIFIVVFGLLGQGTHSYDVGIRSGSVQSGPLYEAIKQVDILNLVTGKDDAQLDDMLHKGQIPATIDIQIDKSAPQTPFPRYLLTIQKSGAAPQDAQTVSAVLGNIVSSINTQAGESAHSNVVKVNETVISGRKFEQIDFILPGQLAFALLTNALFGVSIAFVTMRKELITKRLFASPASRWSILIGEAISKFIIAIIQALLIILVGYYMFHFTLANGIATLIAMVVLSLIGVLTFLALGLFIASIGNTEESISPIANLIMMPQLFLSGAFFPIDLFPAFLQPIARILPLTFLNDAFKKVAFEGAPLSATLPQIAGLLVWGIIFYLIDAKLFRWE